MWNNPPFIFAKAILWLTETSKPLSRSRPLGAAFESRVTHQRCTAELWIGGWKHLTFSMGDVASPGGFKYLFRIPNISLLRIWNLRTRSTNFFNGCNKNNKYVKTTLCDDINSLSLFRCKNRKLCYFSRQLYICMERYSGVGGGNASAPPKI